jgi:hypothetical protein
VRVDVKATRGTFDAGFYVSINELKAMSQGIGYRIYRISAVNESDRTADLTVSADVGDWASQMVRALRGLPAGLDAMNFRVDPSALQWEYSKRLRL